MSIPDTATMFGPEDNLSRWSQQYPALLPRNFLGIARIWDEQKPFTMSSVFPARNMPFHFSWRVNVNPGQMAPFVGEGADTPMSDAEEKLETFVCQESRLGGKITSREINFGIPNVVMRRVTQLTDAVNLTRDWLGIQALSGVNANQADSVSRINTAVAGQPHGSGTAAGWDESSGVPLDDILAMATTIKKASMPPTKLFMPPNEIEYLQRNDEVLDQLRYTDNSLLVEGQIKRIKGMDIIEVSNFWKERKPDGTEVRHYVLEDKVIMTTPTVGFMAVSEPRAGSAPFVERWWDRSKRSIIVHAFSSFTPVVQDYARIGVITGTDSTI